MLPKRKKSPFRKKGKNVGKKLKYRRATRLKYLRFPIPEGQRLQKKIIRNYWRYLTFNPAFHSSLSNDLIANQLNELVGIVVIPNRKNSIVRGVVEYPAFREIINDISVVENSILETALVSKIVVVFGDAPTLWRLQKTLGFQIKFEGQTFWKKVFYIPNTFLSEDRRAMIWYAFRCINKAVETGSDMTYLKYFFHFCYESFDTAKYYKMIREANPVQSIVFECADASFLTGGATPILLSALDIFKIRRMKKWDSEEFMRRAYHPRRIEVDLIHDFTTKSGIVDYLRSGDTYVEDRRYGFHFRLRRKKATHETNRLHDRRNSTDSVRADYGVRPEELQLHSGKSDGTSTGSSIGSDCESSE